MVLENCRIGSMKNCFYYATQGQRFKSGKPIIINYYNASYLQLSHVLHRYVETMLGILTGCLRMEQIKSKGIMEVFLLPYKILDEHTEYFEYTPTAGNIKFLISSVQRDYPLGSTYMIKKISTA